MKQVDHIIVGQGLAGTCMAFRLLKEGRKVILIDEESDISASLISSGIINPITGRRYVKSWMFDQLLPVALQFYKEVGELLGLQIIEPKKVLRALGNVLEENIWHGQSSKPDYEGFFGEIISDSFFTEHFKNDLVLGEVKNTYQVSILDFIITARDYFKANDMFITSHTTLDDFAIGESVRFQNIQADSIIFSEGWKVIKNPLFENLPFDPTKGEVFICDLPEYKLTEVVKNQKFIVPWGDQYWVGSTNQNKSTDDHTSPEKQEELVRFLDEIVKSPYSITRKVTAVRPSTKQRRPIIGLHPDYLNVYLLNGLGTKGASLGPYFSKMLADLIVHKKALIDEVNMARFYN